jgi:hypothetical protein
LLFGGTGFRGPVPVPGGTGLFSPWNPVDRVPSAGGKKVKNWFIGVELKKKFKIFFNVRTYIYFNIVFRT